MMKPIFCLHPNLIPPCSRSRGFTLIEIAVVLIIIGLLLGGMLPALSTQAENLRLRDARDQLAEIKQAIIGYALTNDQLPCPDCRVGGSGCTAVLRNDGMEDRNGAICRVLYGNLPWATLGIPQATGDPWGTRFGYYVDTTYDGGTPLTLSMTSTATVLDNLTGTVLTRNAIAVIVSYGRNRAGGTNTGTPAGSANVMTGSPMTGSNEVENNDADATFIYGDHTGPGTPNGQFDDILTWLSPNELNYHMVQAGRLP